MVRLANPGYNLEPRPKFDLEFNRSEGARFSIFRIKRAILGDMETISD